MTRLVLNKVDQRVFLLGVCRELEMSTEQVGKLVGICGRNYRDWINGKLLPRKDAIEKLSEMSGVPMPKIIEEREEWWSGRINGKVGGKVRFKKYGLTLTREDVTKGGHISQVRRSENPEYYRALGCNVPTEFVIPPYSCDLAEFVGIVLGDGGLTDGQCEISLHMIDDRDYARHVQRLANKLFKARSSISSYPKHNVIKVVISGVKFTQILEKFGLKKGNKTKNQVDIPDWINQNSNYLRACMRGLFDTDGGTFTHAHMVNGHRYLNFGLTFTSASKPMLTSFKQGLIDNGFDVHGTAVNVFLYGVTVAGRFFDIFNPSIQYMVKYEKLYK